MTDDELKLLFAQTAQLIDSNAKSIAALSHATAENTQSIANLRASIADVIQMVTTQAEEAAADRVEMRRMIESMFGNPRNGNGSSEENPRPALLRTTTGAYRQRPQRQ